MEQAQRGTWPAKEATLAARMMDEAWQPVRSVAEVPQGARIMDEAPVSSWPMEETEAEVLVIGAGAAGLTAALGCVPRRVVVLTKTALSASGGGGASVWAQGGVASAVGDDDDPALHAADTLAAGAGLNDARIVRLLTGEGPQRIRALLEMGARFDRDAGGRLALGREAAHSRRRILHAHGDATGAEVVRTLVEAVHREPAIQVVDRTFALDLLVEDGMVVGVAALRPDGSLVHYRAPAVVLATGGAGQLFLHTTNPREATADGLAMAARAGAVLVDLEFVQFHPTALAPRPALGGNAGLAASALGGNAGLALSPDAPLPLLTEALRGEGAVLIDDLGTRFMTGEHADRELAPRDVVARATWKRLQAGRRVFLDAREAVGEKFPERFPTVFALCRQHGVDPRVEPMPVVPAAHYHMGGVAVDASGRTSLPGLWACGEVAATGAHGANRLASNSLLEALVFGARVAADLLAENGATPGNLGDASAAAPLQAVPADVASRQAGAKDTAPPRGVPAIATVVLSEANSAAAAWPVIAAAAGRVPGANAERLIGAKAGRLPGMEEGQQFGADAGQVHGAGEGRGSAAAAGRLPGANAERLIGAKAGRLPGVEEGQQLGADAGQVHGTGGGRVSAAAAGRVLGANAEREIGTEAGRLWGADSPGQGRAAGAEAMVGRLRRLMWERVGVERTGAGLAAATDELAAMVRRAEQWAGTVRRPEKLTAAGEAVTEAVGEARNLAWTGGLVAQAVGEARNLAWTGGLVAQAALARRESRGGHYRADHPCPDLTWQRRLFLIAGSDGTARWVEGPQGERPANTAGERGGTQGEAVLARAADRRL